MRNHFRLAAVVASAFAMVAGAHAVSFSNIFINGSPAGSGNPTNFGLSGLSFALPTNFLVGTGSQTATLSYRVDATPGNYLSGFSIFPVGNVKNANVTITTNSVNSGTETSVFSQTSSGTLDSLNNQTYSFTPGKTFYDVSTTIVLTGTAADSLAHVSIYNVSYAEAVPEPGTLAALALGATAIAARRRRNRRA